MVPRGPKPPVKQPKLAPSNGIAKRKRVQKSKLSQADDSAIKAALIVAQRNCMNSPFLRLPGELRNQIYAYLVDVPETPNLDTTVLLHDSGGRMMTFTTWNKLRTTDFVCRAIRSEVGSLLPDYDTMSFADTEDFHRVSKKLRKHIKTNIRCIKFGRIGDPQRVCSLRRCLKQLRSWENVNKVVIMSWFEPSLAATLDERAQKQGGKWQWEYQSKPKGSSYYSHTM